MGENSNPEGHDDGLKDMSLDDLSTNATRIAAPLAKSEMPNVPEIELRGILGRGGMGVVYSGRQPYLNRQVAVKLLKRMGSEEDQVQFQTRFQREAQILAALAHPNIVACYQAGVTDRGECYLAMEFIEGPNLQSHLNAHGALSVAHALSVTSAISAALAYAQSRGIIHRDVKPENILLQRAANGLEAGAADFPFVPRLVDLGLARPHGEAASDTPQLTVEGAIMGTPSTMAPEQINAPDGVDFRADIYGLGCVLFNMLTGKRAFPQRNVTEIFAAKSLGVVPNPREIDPRMPDDVSQLCRDMLAPNANDRPSYDSIIERCGELLRAISKADATTHVAPKATAKWTPAKIALLTLGASALLAVAFSLLPRDSEKTPGNAPATVASPAAARTATPTPTAILSPVPSPTPIPDEDFRKMRFGTPQWLVAGYEQGLSKFEKPQGTMQWDIDEVSTTSLVAAHAMHEASSQGYLKLKQVPAEGFELTVGISEVDEQAGLFVFSDKSGCVVTLQDLGGTKVLNVRNLPADTTPEKVLSVTPTATVNVNPGVRKVVVRVAGNSICIVNDDRSGRLLFPIGPAKSVGLFALGGRARFSDVTIAPRIP